MKKSMNVLFIWSENDLDYECDCVFHGLNSINGVNVDTINDYWFMYEGCKEEDLNQLYGKGFTITNHIDIHKKNVISISEAKEKIKNRFYDCIIFGSIMRYKKLLHTTLKHYPANKIIFIDGDDETYCRDLPSPIHIRTFLRYLRNRFTFRIFRNKGLYFKRELADKYSKEYKPISFAVPEELILKTVPQKQKTMAHIVPGKISTYIYNDQQSYYEDYALSKFGITVKKAGWDCLRHYEILANACIPYFYDISKCPEKTMANFPKDLIIRCMEEKDAGMTDERYYELSEKLLEYTKENLTTKKLAEYVLSFIE